MSEPTPNERTPAPGEGDRGVYIISVAAELVGVHPQTLRIYERRGLLTPSRTSGNTRRYSERDIERLRTIQRLTQEGVGLAGVKMIVEMENELDRLRERMDQLLREVERTRREALERVEAARRSGRSELVPLRDHRQVRMTLRSSGRVGPASPALASRPIALGPPER
jgi:MerR family transcriptional regulator/heat shock protein HspR